MRRPIQPEKGLLLWSPKSADTVLICRHCDTGEHIFSQELDSGLVRLLLFAGWLDDDLRPTAKLLTAAKKGMAQSSL
jgi:hypothetical protein